MGSNSRRCRSAAGDRLGADVDGGRFDYPRDCAGPGVSSSVTGRPSNVREVGDVVPRRARQIGDDAAHSPNSALASVLLPALGIPMIAIRGGSGEMQGTVVEDLLLRSFELQTQYVPTRHASGSAASGLLPWVRASGKMLEDLALDDSIGVDGAVGKRKRGRLDGEALALGQVEHRADHPLPAVGTQVGRLRMRIPQHTGSSISRSPSSRRP